MYPDNVAEPYQYRSIVHPRSHNLRENSNDIGSGPGINSTTSSGPQTASTVEASSPLAEDDIDQPCDKHLGFLLSQADGGGAGTNTIKIEPRVPHAIDTAASTNNESSTTAEGDIGQPRPHRHGSLPPPVDGAESSFTSATSRTRVPASFSATSCLPEHDIVDLNGASTNAVTTTEVVASAGPPRASSLSGVDNDQLRSHLQVSLASPVEPNSAGNTPTTLTGGEDAIATAASWLPGNDANQTCPLRLVSHPSAVDRSECGTNITISDARASSSPTDVSLLSEGDIDLHRSPRQVSVTFPAGRKGSGGNITIGATQAASTSDALPSVAVEDGIDQPHSQRHPTLLPACVDDGRDERTDRAKYTENYTVKSTATACSAPDARRLSEDDAIGQARLERHVSFPSPVDTEMNGPTSLSEWTKRSKSTEHTGQTARKHRTSRWANRNTCRIGPSADEGDCCDIGGNTAAKTGVSTATAVGGGKKMGLKRLETPVFQQYRNLAAQKSDREEGRAGGGGGRRVAEGGWNKMAIVRIHRRKKEPKTR